MDNEVIYVDAEDVEVIDSPEYSCEPKSFFRDVPEIAKPLLKGANNTFDKIEKMLYTTPSLINAIKAAIPDTVLQAILTDDQKTKIAKGALKLMTKKDGSLMANLVNPKTNKIVATIPLKSVEMAPKLSQALVSFSTQMQMAQIAEQIQSVQVAIEAVRQGQEYDRLATAYSCQQKLLQAREMHNSALKSSALLQIALSAEDSRNLLMLSQKANIKYIQDQPEAFWGKLIHGDQPEKINARMNELREGLKAINLVSLSEAMAYCEMGEQESAKRCLSYYGDFIKDAYLSSPRLVERLDLMDPSPENYWSGTLPDIEKNIIALPSKEDTKLIGE